MRIRSFIFAAILLLNLFSCGQPNKEVISQPSFALPYPIVLVVDDVISGRVLNDLLSNPAGLAVDFEGRIYVVDAGNSRIVRLTSDLIPDREIGGHGVDAGLLDRPSFLTFDNGLNFMVSDEGNRRVSRYNSQLNFVDYLSFYDDEDPQKFGYPSGLAFSDYGEVWIADRDQNRIAVFSNVGKFDRFIGDFGYAGGQLADPEKIVRNADGDFIVCDAGSSRLVNYDRYGNFSKEIELEDLVYPSALELDDDKLWVLDGVGNQVVCIDEEGNWLAEAGPTIPGNNTSMKEPSDLLLLPSGRLLITDSGNNRILVCRIVYENK